MAVHTGEALDHNGSYFGQTIIRTARLRACGHGGQILVSRTTADMVVDGLPDGVSLIPLGRHRLRVSTPVREEVWQVAATDLRTAFPALMSLDSFATNLPIALTPLIGRTDELAAVGVSPAARPRATPAHASPVRAGSARPVWRYSPPPMPSTRSSTGCGG